MKGEYTLILCTICLCLMVIGCKNGEFDTQSAPETVSITFVKTDSLTLWKSPIWKVVDDEDPPSPGTTVHRGDTLIFFSENSDVELQFPNNYKALLRDPSVEEEEDHYRKLLRRKERLTLVVRDNAPYGTYEYAALIREDCVLAEGDSAPTFEIDR